MKTYYYIALLIYMTDSILKSYKTKILLENKEFNKDPKFIKQRSHIRSKDVFIKSYHSIHKSILQLFDLMYSQHFLLDYTCSQTAFLWSTGRMLTLHNGKI